jgi:hypothetical protein
MSIYRDLINAVGDGKKFKVDLIHKSLWIDKKQIIREGEIVYEQDKSKDLIKKWDLALDYGNTVPLDENHWNAIEFLYKEFKHSAPSEHSNKKSYFKALSVDELTDEELAYNIDRDFGQCLIEGYILLASLQGWLKWEHGDYWFWQSETDENLIVLRNWVE